MEYTDAVEQIVKDHTADSEPLSLSPDEVKAFSRNGFLGPYTLLEPEQMHALWTQLRHQLASTKTAPYAGSRMNYDRHLDLKLLSMIISHRRIVSRVQGILGKDVLCWRSEWFPKYPGDEGSQWHQTQAFPEFEGMPKLNPTQTHDGPYELTVWVALTEASRETACMKLLPGSQDKWFFDDNRKVNYEPELINQKVVAGKRMGFYGYDWDKLKYDRNWQPDESEAVYMELKPGQFFLFTSRCVHGSEPNTSKDKTRFALSVRYVRTHVQVYGGLTEHEHYGEKFSLERYAAVLVGGKDDFGHNRICAPL